MQAKPVVSMARLTSVQALRGFAALLVLFFHIAAYERVYSVKTFLVVQQGVPSSFNGFWDLGYAGVDLFFVISGFIMVYVTRTYDHSFTNVFRFLRARFARIYPLWWVFSAVLPLYYYLVYPGSAEPYRVEHSVEIIPHLLKSFLLVPQTVNPTLVVGWTLIHEVYFYFVFAGLLFLPKKHFPLGLLIWAGVIFAGLGMGFEARSISIVLAPISSPLTLEFIAGTFAGLLIYHKVYRFARVMAFGGVISLFFLFVFYGQTLNWVAALGRVAIFTLPSVALLYGLSAMEITGRLVAPIWMQRLGDWSYSLYLSHLLVLLVVKRVYIKLTGHLPENLSKIFILGAPGGLDNILFAIISLVACITFAWFSYRFLERPLINFSKKVLKL